MLLVDPGIRRDPVAGVHAGAASVDGPVAVRELDVAVVPANVQGGGIGKPPRVTGPQPAPPGFTLTGAVHDATYTVLRYTSPAPVTVSPSLAAAPWLGQSGYGALVQDADR